MNVQRMEAIQEISRYLSFLSDYTLMLNEIGDTSVNKHAESALIGMFNILFDGQFINTNSIQKNAPSIDLIDNKKRIGIQITATNKFEKVKKCIESYFKYKIYEKADVLYLYILTIRGKYSQANIDNFISECYRKYDVPERHAAKFRFNWVYNVLDKPALIALIDIKDVATLGMIRDVLNVEFEPLKVSSGLGRYYEILKSKFCDIVLNDEAGMTLKDIYVDPVFLFYKNSIQNVDLFKKREDNFFSMDKKLSAHHFVNDYFFAGNICKGLNSSKIILLLGYPGQGKTSFCKKVLHDYVLNGKQKEKNLFYFKLKDVPNSKDLINAPLNVLVDEIQTNADLQISKNTLKNAVLLLDGLDELYMKDGLRLDDIETFCKELIREVESEGAKELKIILTSRRGYVDLDKLKRENILIVQLAPLTIENQMQWLDKYQRYHNTWLSISKLKEYNKKQDRKYSYIKELLEQPILLHMLASLKKEISKAITRSKVYNQLFSELIDRKYSSDGQIQILKEIKKEDLRLIVREIAFNIYQTGDGFINRTRILKVHSVQKYLEKFPTADFQNSIKGLMVSFYFNESVKSEANDDGNYSIEFVHKSLEEYMAAEYIVTTLTYSLLNKGVSGEYIFDNHVDVLKLLSSLFSKQPLSREIQEYIMEIIDELSPLQREEVANRVSYFFDDLVACDFLFEYNCEQSQHPLFQSLMNFNGFWLFAKNISPERNYLSNKATKEQVFNYFVILDSQYPGAAFEDISNQNFDSIEIHNASTIGTPFISGVSFLETKLNYGRFVGCEIENVIFNKSSLFQIGFYDAALSNCSMSDCDLSQLILYNVVFRNVDFSYSDIYDWQITNVSFIDVGAEKFDHIKIDLESFVKLAQCGAKFNLNNIHVIKNSLEAFSKAELLEILHN